MARPCAPTLLLVLLTTLVLAGCARHAWLLPPNAIVGRHTAVRIVVRDDRGQEHDLGRGRWGSTSSGVEVLSVPEVAYGELVCELTDGTTARTVFDDRNFDPDLDGLPTGIDPSPFPVRPVRDVDDDVDEDHDEDVDEWREDREEREARDQRRQEEWSERRQSWRDDPWGDDD